MATAVAGPNLASSRNALTGDHPACRRWLDRHVRHIERGASLGGTMAETDPDSGSGPGRRGEFQKRARHVVIIATDHGVRCVSPYVSR
jgi:hypothetical protein